MHQKPFFVKKWCTLKLWKYKKIGLKYGLLLKDSNLLVDDFLSNPTFRFLASNPKIINIACHPHPLSHDPINSSFSILSPNLQPTPDNFLIHVTSVVSFHLYSDFLPKGRLREYQMESLRLSEFYSADFRKSAGRQVQPLLWRYGSGCLGIISFGTDLQAGRMSLIIIQGIFSR